MEFALLIALIVANGLFAMSEIALVTARRARLQRLADDGDASARVAIALAEDPNRLLSTVQIGITSISILNGIVGEAAFAGPISQWLVSLGVAPRPAALVSTVAIVLIITYVSIVIGELVPKRIGQIGPEAIARRVARPMTWLASASRPFVWLLSISTDAVLRVIGMRDAGTPGVTEEEIHAMIEEGSSAGIIERNEHTMLRNVFGLDERRVGSMMVPRSEIVYLDKRASLPENLAMVERSVHSRFPLCDGGLDHVLGFVHSKQLLVQSLAGRPLSLDVALIPPLFVPETLTGLELLENFRRAGRHAALVVDEYGQLQGMVTLHDLLEAIAGELRAPEQGEREAIEREDGSWLLDALIPVHELKQRLGIATVPEEEHGRYNALSGMLMLLLGRLPRTGDIVTWAGWRFEVIDVDGRRVDKVLASRIESSPCSGPPADGTAAPADHTTAPRADDRAPGSN